MYRRGHMGLTLLILSPFMKSFTDLFGDIYSSVTFIVLSTLFSVLPDIDLRIGIKHRGATHSITLAILLSVILCYIFYILNLNMLFGLSAFIGITSHLIGDLITYRSFAPFYPFSKKKFSLKIVKSENRFINDALFLLGALVFSYEFLYNL